MIMTRYKVEIEWETCNFMKNVQVNILKYACALSFKDFLVLLFLKYLSTSTSGFKFHEIFVIPGKARDVFINQTKRMSADPEM